MMKLMKMFSTKLGLVLVLAILATACEKTDTPEKDDLKKQPNEEYTNASISEIEIPDGIEAGVPATFVVTFEKPNPCYEFKQLQLQTEGATTIVSVAILLDTDDLCIMVIEEGRTDFTLTFPEPGNYFFEYGYYDEIKTILFRVQ